MTLYADLAGAGLGLIDDYLPAKRVRALAACAEARRACGGFRAARIGAPERMRKDAAVRGDSTCWLDAPLAPAELQLFADLEALRLELNRELGLGLFELEAHYARYPAGAAYQRHVDQPQGRGRRLLSLVLYLNEGWDAASGGQLRLFEAGAAPVDVLPIAGRLVCFLSSGREHEVLPSMRARWSVTGWFLSRDHAMAVAR